MPANIEYLNEKRDALKRLKDPWLYQYQILGKYIYSKKQSFMENHYDGAFLNDGMINDSTAVRANSAMASAIMGALWKNGGKTFKLVPSDGIPDTEAVRKYFRRINRELWGAMESPQAGFETALHEELCEEGAFGTSCLALFQGDYANPLIFKSWSIQNLLIVEGERGYVDTVYYDESITIANLASRYGLENLPKSLREKYSNAKTKQDRVVLTVAIEPRPEDERIGAGVYGMPIASYHFLPGEKTILRESGFVELPAYVGRWYKLANEVYGRSPGMDALPAIMQINSLKEAFLVGVEKKVEPPLWVLDDGSLGAGVVDTSARGLSVFNAMGKTGMSSPIGTIFDVGELQSSAAAIVETKEEILQHFLIDRLYDLNNKARMTLGEAEMRYQIRSDALSAVYARNTNEKLNPLINRSFNIMFDMGLLGVREDDVAMQAVLYANGINPIIIPAEIVLAIEEGRRIYEINYISPAARVMRDEEYRGLMATANNAMQLTAAGSDAMIKLNVDKVLERSSELSGAPDDILFSDDEVKKRRQAIAKMQQAAQQAELAEVASKAGKNVAQAKAAVAQPVGA